MGGKVEKIEIELRISCSNTMLNYQFFQKLKQLGYDKFNHLTTYSLHYVIKIISLSSVKQMEPLNLNCLSLVF